MNSATASETGAAVSSLDIATARFAALAHPVRVRILHQLACKDACCCREVVETMNLAQSTVSQHLKVLVDAGLVEYRPDRQRSRYSVDRKAMAETRAALAKVLGPCCAPLAPEKEDHG